MIFWHSIYFLLLEDFSFHFSSYRTFLFAHFFIFLIKNCPYPLYFVDYWFPPFKAFGWRYIIQAQKEKKGGGHHWQFMLVCFMQFSFSYIANTGSIVVLWWHWMVIFWEDQQNKTSAGLSFLFKSSSLKIYPLLKK